MEDFCDRYLRQVITRVNRNHGGKMTRKVILLFFAAMLLNCPLQAGQAKQSFVVLPVKVHGPESYQYLSHGIQSMLVSRLFRKERFEPMDQARVDQAAVKDVITNSQARQVQTKLDTDYLFWGSVTIMGQQASLDLNYQGPEGRVQKKGTSTDLENLIPDLERLAREISTEILGEEPLRQEADQGSPEAGENQFMNPNIKQIEESPQDFYLNPAIDYRGSISGRWRSQSLPYVGIGMVVGDADADGKNEIFILHDHGVKAYRVKQNKLQPLAEYKISGRSHCLNINLMDMQQDGYLEIIVSSRHDNQANSFILNFRREQFQVVANNIRLYLNVVRLVPYNQKTLVGQKDGGSGRLFQSGVHEVIPVSGKYELGRGLSLPRGANVFNFVYLPQEKGYKIVVADKNDYLDVYSDTKELLTTTKDTFAASGVRMEIDTSNTGWGPDAVPRYYFVPSRLAQCNLDKDNRFELLVSRNISVAASYVSNYRNYPEGEIHCLYWTGVGIGSVWKTRRIQGMIVDYGIADPDNDQNQDLCVLINTHPGTVGLRDKKTILLSYDLDLQRAGQGGGGE